MNAILGILALSAAVAAFLALGLATERHYRNWRGPVMPPAFAATMRLVGTALLALSAFGAILARGFVFGPVLWLGFVMIGAATAFLSLNSKEIGHRSRPDVGREH